MVVSSFFKDSNDFREGHNYAAKWLWNRLMAGPTIQEKPQDEAYYCPKSVIFLFKLILRSKKKVLQ